MTARKGVARAVVAAMLVSLVAWWGAPPVLAHSSQIGSTPAADEVVTEAPGAVVIEFDTPLLDIGAAVVVRGTDGDSVVAGPVVADQRTLTAPVDPQAPPGVYTVAYRVVSEDGHTLESSFTYAVAGTAVESSASTVPATSAPARTAPAVTATSADAQESGWPVILLIGGAFLVIVLAVAGAIALRR